MIERTVQIIRSKVKSILCPAPHNSTTNAEFVDIAYRGVLGRAADPTALSSWAPNLSNERRENLLAMLVASPEFQRNYLHRRVQKEGKAAIAAINNRLSLSALPKPLHVQRLKLVQNHLPVARKILDLGGAAGDQQGALLGMGYRGAQEITIIDLPADIRFKSALETQQVSEHHGTTVRYAYHSMADLARYPDESFDLIWSGQTMEHISLSDGDKVFKHVPRILKRGGIFALDTPNRTLTRLAVGDDGFIHAEHAHEYRFEEMRDRHLKCGLTIVDTKGVINLPRSLVQNYLLPDEIEDGVINNNPETSLVFFIKYQKP